MGRSVRWWVRVRVGRARVCMGGMRVVQVVVDFVRVSTAWDGGGVFKDKK